MDFQPDYKRPDLPGSENGSQYQHYNQSGNGSRAMTTAAVTLSIIAISTICCIYPSFICGALGIIFALLSKGDTYTMSSTSRSAFWISITAMAFTVIYVVIAFVVVISQYGSLDAVMDAYMQMVESYASQLSDY